MNIYQGETIDLLLSFREEDDQTPADLTGTDVSVSVWDRAHRAVLAYTTRAGGPGGMLTDLGEGTFLAQFSAIDTSALCGDYVVEFKVTRRGYVMIEQSCPFRVRPSSIGKESRL